MTLAAFKRWENYYSKLRHNDDGALPPIAAVAAVAKELATPKPEPPPSLSDLASGSQRAADPRKQACEVARVYRGSDKPEPRVPYAVELQQRQLSQLNAIAWRLEHPLSRGY